MYLRKFEFSQTTPSTTWNINHAMGATPSVDVSTTFDSEEVKIYPKSIEIIDADNVKITWSIAQAGSATLVA